MQRPESGKQRCEPVVARIESRSVITSTSFTGFKSYECYSVPLSVSSRSNLTDCCLQNWRPARRFNSYIRHFVDKNIICMMCYKYDAINFKTNNHPTGVL
jgi:hypothetical protein